jgi:hypothetical protein
LFAYSKSLSDPIKCDEFLDLMRDCYVMEKLCFMELIKAGFVVLKEQRMFEESVIAYLNISSSVLSDLHC